MASRRDATDVWPGSGADLPPRGRAAVVVAHPDDETLWAGGTILSHRGWDWFVLSLCRKSDPDRAPKFLKVLAELGASGAIADLDDGPDQASLSDADVRSTILAALPEEAFDLCLTHGPKGEYTRHLRHEETSRAVAALWRQGKIEAGELWTFAYEDGGGAHLPRAVESASVKVALSEEIWRRKREIIVGTYGFGPESFEARTTPREEAFRRFSSVDEVDERFEKGMGTT